MTSYAWDDGTRTVTTRDGSGEVIATRSYTPEENAEANARIESAAWEAARTRYLADLATAVPGLIEARDQAQADIDAAEALRAQAVTLAGQVQAHVAEMTAWNPTANLAGVTALRNALVSVANRQKVIVDAVAQMYVYRKAVDANAVRTDNALLWLARLTAEVTLGEEG